MTVAASIDFQLRPLGVLPQPRLLTSTIFRKYCRTILYENKKQGGRRTGNGNARKEEPAKRLLTSTPNEFEAEPTASGFFTRYGARPGWLVPWGRLPALGQLRGPSGPRASRTLVER